MPIFEFQCNKCGKKFEKLCRGDEKVNCPKCKGKNVKKLFSTFATKTERNISMMSSKSSCGSCSATSCDTCSH